MSKICALVFHRIVKETITELSDVKIDFLEYFLKSAMIKDIPVCSLKKTKQDIPYQLVLTFDDGNKTDLDIVLPLLKKYNASATFFVATNFIGKKDYMSWSEITELSKAGMEIGSHSVNHSFLSSISDEKLEIELKKSKETIERNLGITVESFAYPYGDYSNKTNRIALSLGYKKICNSRPGIVSSNKKIIPRNSIYSLSSIKEIDEIISGNNFIYLKKKVNYEVRSLIKSSIGNKNYMKLKKYLFH